MGSDVIAHHICDEKGQGATAHNLIELVSSTRSREKVMGIVGTLDPNEVTLLASFGEVDCRLHLRSDADVLRTTRRYQDAINLLMRSEGFRVIVSAVIGAVPQPNKHNLPDYPPPEVRGWWVLLFNREMELWCEARGIRFLRADTHDAKGALRPGLTDDQVHLNVTGERLLREALEAL